MHSIQKTRCKDHNATHKKKAIQIDRNTREIFPEDT